VTLATTGFPTIFEYAKQARLVRQFQTTSGGPAVAISGGGALKSVWVDGQRSVSFVFKLLDINIAMLGGTGTTVDNVRSTNTTGWTSLFAAGSDGRLSGGIYGSHPCSANKITNSFVTGYQAAHNDSTWGDGISIGCEDTTVTNNGVIDATDVGIILFEGWTATQKSQVTGNMVLSAGLSAYAAYAMDPLTTGDGGLASYSFAGAAISNNNYWTGGDTHFDIGLAVGTRAWFGNSSSRGIGGSFVNNSTQDIAARVDTGIAIGGMSNVTVTGNTTNFSLVNSNNCPNVKIAAAVSAGWASGTIQGPYTDVDFPSCITGGR